MTQGLASLDSLGIIFATDKSSWGHDYLGFYEAHFAPLRYKPIKLLEIGVAGGGSLKVWENYFLEGTIVGADINPAAKQYARPRVHIEIIDQSDTEQLVRL